MDALAKLAALLAKGGLALPQPQSNAEHSSVAVAMPAAADVPVRMCDWAVPTRVYHPERGAGRVCKVDYNDPRDRPVHVRFGSGEVHHYTLTSAAAKLERISGPPLMSAERRGVVLAKIRAVGATSAAFQRARVRVAARSAANTAQSALEIAAEEEVGNDITYGMQFLL